MTIDELARAGSVVVSTVRLYQNRRLLPPPERRGRVGYYGPDHLRRLRLIAQLQERGFSLAAIRELLDGLDRGTSLGTLLGMGSVPSTWVSEPPRRMTLDALAEHLPDVELDARLVQRVAALGLVVPVTTDDEAGSDRGPGHVEVLVHDPSFLRIGRELLDLGVPADVILDEYEVLRDQAGRIAERFTEVFRSHLWEPFVQAGMPAGDVDTMVDALERLGGLAEDVVVMALRRAIQGAADEFVDAEAERLGVDMPRPGRRAGVA
jgi:DNA-binding transcriptional MerR regulator